MIPLKLRYYQQKAVDNFFNYVGENHGRHPIVVIPTAGGKSLIQAHIVKHMLDYDQTRILLLTHQKILIQQNYNELMENFNNDMFIDAGIYSAGLKCRDTKNRILLAGIQSVHKKAWELGWFDLILIDEAHLVSHEGEGMYRTFLAEMVKINPKIVIGGLSATPYRLKHGLLTEGKGHIFDAICYEVSIKELIDPQDFRNLDHKQYLCKPVSKGAVNKVDLTGVHIRGGEYIEGEMEKAFQAEGLVGKAVAEIITLTQNRKKCLVFCAGIKHCDEVAVTIGEQARAVHSGQKDEINDKNIADFKAGKFKFLCNVNSLTTGFNEKAIDAIILLRSTMSPGLYSQMCGRGFRLHPDKEDFLILDFGKNIERHGPIDKIEVRKKADGTGYEVGTAPVKECPICQDMVAISVMICPSCGHEFPQKDKHEEQASELDVISKWKKPVVCDISVISYSRHQKEGKPDSLSVTYSVSAYESYNEWVCVEHEGFAGKKARSWLQKRTPIPIQTVSEALEVKEYFRLVKQVIIDENDKFPRITGYIFETQEELEARIEQIDERKRLKSQEPAEAEYGIEYSGNDSDMW